MTAPHGLSADTVSRIQEVLTRFREIRSAVLFGSRARGLHKPGSDIDLALRGDHLDRGLIGRVEEALDDLLLPYTFSLFIEDERLDPAVALQIKRYGYPLHSSSR